MKAIRHTILGGCCLLLAACLQDEQWQGTDPVSGDALQLNITTEGLMDQFVVTTRGEDVKTPEEQEIKSLHIFIFDADGNYLKALDQHRYQGYRSITDGKTVMNIDRQGWADYGKAKTATVIAVANVETGTFQFGTEADQPPVNIGNREALANFVYKPTVERLITQLPESGMPMYCRVDSIDLTSENTAQSIDIPLRALMARVDVSIQIDSEHSDVTGTLPQLSVTSCEVLNVPQSVAFTENTGEETDLEARGKEDVMPLPTTAVETISNGRGMLEYTFYTFENLQEPAVSDYVYPDSISEDEKQQYKPELADQENALAFRFSGNYITYNGASYNATYTLYLGANHTDDFKVMRNKQYKNNVTIRGIFKAGNNPEHITFDTRVNITESNPYFISMLKDRTLDSHFNVVPMDVYFFNTNPSNPNPPKQTMKVKIEDGVDWVRMERIPSAEMEEGKAHKVSSGPELMATGEAWHAGNGKRKYFTTDLVTITLAANTEVTIENSRDRVYFYVDENLDVWHLRSNDPRTRTATVTLTYYEDKVEKGTRTLTLEQARLLEVEFIAGDPGDEDEDMVDRKFYIEAYEEYLDHGDPLNEYANNQVYTGLPWEDYDGGSGTTIGSLNVKGGLFGSEDCSSNFYWGHAFTEKIAQEVESHKENSGGWFPTTTYSYAHLDLNSKPKTAAGYCFIKNKRDAEGNVPNPKWYLPGIRELERILRAYYGEYTEFQNHYYWSSAAGQGGGWYNESNNHARATKAYIKKDGSFDYYESGPDYTYEGEDGEGGYAPRKTILRIRAARYDDEPQE